MASDPKRGTPKSKRSKSEFKFIPKVSVIVVDVLLSANKQQNSYSNECDAIRQSLESYGDLLAQYPSRSLVSLIQLGNSAKSLVKLGKLNMIDWRHSVANLEFELHSSDSKEQSKAAWLEMFSGLKEAKNGLSLISNWTVTIITYQIEKLQDLEICSKLSSIDSSGISVEAILISPSRQFPPLEPTQPSMETFTDLGQSRESPPVSPYLDTLTKIKISFSTGLINAVIIAIEDDHFRRLYSYFQLLVLSQTQIEQPLNRRVMLVFSRTLSLACSILNPFFHPPSIDLLPHQFTSIIPHINHNIQHKDFEKCILLGLSSTISNFPNSVAFQTSSSTITRSTILDNIQQDSPTFSSQSKDIHVSQQADIVNLMVRNRLQTSEFNPVMTKGHDLILKVGSLSNMNNGKKVTSVEEKQNKSNWKAVWKTLQQSQECVVISTKFDLERLESDGRMSLGVLERFYAVIPPGKDETFDEHSIFWIRSLITREEIIASRMPVFIKNAPENDDSGSTTIEDEREGEGRNDREFSISKLQVDLAFNEIPMVQQWDPQEYSSGYYDFISFVVDQSLPDTKFQFL